MTHGDSAYRQYTQALEEEEQKQQTLPNGYTRNATPTKVSILQSDTMALQSVYEKENEDELPQIDDHYDEQRIPSQSEVPTPPIDQPTQPETYQQQSQNESQPPVEIITSEARDFKQLWRWAYQRALKERGITVSDVFWALPFGVCRLKKQSSNFS